MIKRVIPSLASPKKYTVIASVRRTEAHLAGSFQHLMKGPLWSKRLQL